jgi:hypothetical protein
VVVGVSVEMLTHDRYKWRGEDIANINKIAQRWVHVQQALMASCACSQAVMV